MMGSSDNEEEASSKKLNQLKYSKVLPGGILDSNFLEDEDYEFVKRFVHHAFPKATQVHKELEQSLKRTFVLGRSNQKLERSFSTARLPLRATDKKLSKTKRGKLGLGPRQLPRRLQYEHLVPVHALWNSYVAELCAPERDTREIQGKLNRMDLHGAHLSVVQSNCEAYKGLEGIVVKETKNTFIIVTTQNLLKTIPKAEKVFDVKLSQPTGTLRIAGNSFLIRPAERVCKKMKSFVDFVGLKKYKAKLIYSELVG